MRPPADHLYVHRASERDRYYAEGVPGAALYGATSAPTSEAELEALFHAMRGRLERSDIVPAKIAFCSIRVDAWGSDAVSGDRLVTQWAFHSPQGSDATDSDESKEQE